MCVREKNRKEVQELERAVRIPYSVCVRMFVDKPDANPQVKVDV